MGLLLSQVIARLGLSGETIQRLTREGRIRFERLPSGWKSYSEQDISRIKRERARKRNRIIDAETRQ